MNTHDNATTQPTTDGSGEDTARVIDFPRPTSAGAAALVGPVLDAELVDDDPDGGPVAVDPAGRGGEGRSVAARMATHTAAGRRAIVAPWLRSTAEFGAVARWAAGHVAHTAAFHTVRVPLYAGRLAGRSPRGALLGVPSRAVMDVMGWSQASMTTRYQHITTELTISIANQVGELFWAAEVPDGDDDDDGSAGAVVPA